MSKVYIPTAGPADWQRFLADPTKQWRTGFSAKTLAHCWESANGLPNEIASMLQPHGGDVELLLAIPEYKVPLPGASRGESQNDVFALARAGDLTFAIMVEGKVREPFGETLCDWLQNASDGKRKRLAFICDLLGLTLPPPDHIHYQLLHRTASAVIEARRFKTDAAAMIVHSFSPERIWFEALVQFASLFDVAMVANELIAVRPNARPPLYIGWACGDCNFLTA
ncbi:MAG: hypothetical protein HY237_09625 [Acidobacteria bacterium]|nr:hypothetical protein [Acidobacteriota bacterium]